MTGWELLVEVVRAGGVGQSCIVLVLVIIAMELRGVKLVIAEVKTDHHELRTAVEDEVKPRLGAIERDLATNTEALDWLRKVGSR